MWTSSSLDVIFPSRVLDSLIAGNSTIYADYGLVYSIDTELVHYVLGCAAPQLKARPAMAKNTGKGYRTGAVRNRSEFQHPNGTYVKRDTTSGRFMNVSDKPHKGVRDE